MIMPEIHNSFLLRINKLFFMLHLKLLPTELRSYFFYFTLLSSAPSGYNSKENFAAHFQCIPVLFCPCNYY